MVPTALLVTAMVGGFAIAITAILATVHVLGSRITDLRTDMGQRLGSLDERMTAVEEQMTAVRASLGAVDARLTTLEK